MFYFVEEISLMDCGDWSVGQCLQTLKRRRTMFFYIWLSKVYFNVNVLTFERKISK